MLQNFTWNMTIVLLKGRFSELYVLLLNKKKYRTISKPKTQMLTIK